MQFLGLFIIFTSLQMVESAQANEHHVSDTSIAHVSPRFTKDKKIIDYYEYRHVVADGVQKALDECRQKFKWDRWNCPKRAFLGILAREEFSSLESVLPSNKELGLTRSLIASSIVLSMIKTCSVGTNSMCSCTNPTYVPIENSDPPAPKAIYSNLADAGPMSDIQHSQHDMNFNQPDPFHQISRRRRNVIDVLETSSTEHVRAMNSEPEVSIRHETFEQAKSTKFGWAGCDEIVKFGFRIAKMYLDSQDALQGEASRLINAHNYEVGRQAVKKSLKRQCKCHGPSGTCQYKTCWTVIPNMSEVGDVLKRQYRVAAKVGANTAKDSDAASLVKELSAISPEKLVFADASPDYCYENRQLGINGTLGRYCSRVKHNQNGTAVSRSERDSCDRLCTKCGYKIHRELINVEKQCDCRFVYCCSLECKRCPHVEEAYKCARHS